MNKEEFVDNFSIDLTNSTVAERKKYAEKIFNIINDLQQQVFNKTLEIKGIEEVLKAKEQECEKLKKEINGYKTTIEKIRQEFQEGITCESRECGCDNYEECIECLKTTILDIIYDERNDFVEGREICKECGNYKQALDEIEEYCKKRL